jgi:hypothetical protein
VRLEALVFNGDDGLAENRREVVVIDHNAALEGKGANDAALAVVEVGHGGGAVALEVVNLGQVGGEDQRETRQGAGDDGQKKQRGKGCLAGDLTTAENRHGIRLKPVGPAQAARFGRLMGGDSQEL